MFLRGPLLTQEHSKCMYPYVHQKQFPPQIKIEEFSVKKVTN